MLKFRALLLLEGLIWCRFSHNRDRLNTHEEASLANLQCTPTKLPSHGHCIKTINKA